jgi:hypothetical protein
MFRWFNRAGFKADIDGLRRRYPEVHLRSLEEWLAGRRMAQARAACTGAERVTPNGRSFGGSSTRC